MIKVPRLKINRHGVCGIRVYWRDELGKLRESLHSLGTQDGYIDRIVALQFSASFERRRHMTRIPNPPNTDDLIRRYELDIGRGVMSATDSKDHTRPMQAIEAYKSIHGNLPTLQAAMAMGKPPMPTLQKSMLFSKATEAYLDEKKLDSRRLIRK